EGRKHHERRKDSYHRRLDASTRRVVERRPRTTGVCPMRGNVDIYRQYTTFFISNLSADCKVEELWQVFREIGCVIDIFLPKKRGMRWEEVRRIEEVEHKLNQIWLGSYKLSVNRAGFSKESREIEE
ncbi:hypothetical protein Ancab_032099, partial [Ancistrocladus abbreviatus]